MGGGASIEQQNQNQQINPFHRDEFQKIISSLSSSCEPILLRKIALAVLEDDSDQNNATKKEQELKHMLHALANSVHQQKNDVVVQSEEIQALNLMLFDFISVMDSDENHNSNDEIIENIANIVKTKEFVHSIYDADGNSLLMKAVILGNMRLTELLLEFGVDPNQRNFKGLHTLSAVFQQNKQTNRFSTTELLIKYNAKPLMAVDNNENGTTALHLAIKNMDVKCVEILLDNNASVSIIDKRFKMSSIGLAKIMFEESTTTEELQKDSRKTIYEMCARNEENDQNVIDKTLSFTNNIEIPLPREEAKKHLAILRQVSIKCLNVAENTDKSKSSENITTSNIIGKQRIDNNNADDNNNKTILTEGQDVIDHDELIQLRLHDKKISIEVAELQGKLKVAQEKIQTLTNDNIKLENVNKEYVIQHNTDISINQENKNELSKDNEQLKHQLNEMMAKHESDLKELKMEMDKKYQKKLLLSEQKKNVMVNRLNARVESLTDDNKYLLEKLRVTNGERRKYYNQLEDIKGKIRVFVRVRPLSIVEKDRGDQNVISYDSNDNGSIVVKNPIINMPSNIENDGQGNRHAMSEHLYNFDGIFQPAATQKQVFQDTKRLVQSAIDGYNVCIFAYGQTGSGKTFTMSGEGDGELKGLQLRAIDTIYNKIKSNKFATSACSVSIRMLELYQGQLIDLLNEDHEEGNKQKQKLIISQDRNGNVIVANAIIVKCNEKDDILNTIKNGIKTRHISATAMNKESSRSHLIVSIFITTTNTRLGTTLQGKINFIDLAGAERQSQTKATGKTLNEAKGINKSLSILGVVVNQLTSGAKHINYRDSLLTRIMSDSIGGSAKTLMICNVSPSSYSYSETLNTLSFAQRMKEVKNKKAKANIGSKRIDEMLVELDKLRKIVNKRNEIRGSEKS